MKRSPAKTDILNIRAIATTARIVKVTGKPAFVVVNDAPIRAPHLIADATAAIQQHGVPIAPLILHRRSAYVHGFPAGLTAEEYEPEGKAAAEIRALVAWISEIVHSPTSMEAPKGARLKTDKKRAAA